eukprot:7383685-Prymnesium_polylepis.1
MPQRTAFRTRHNGHSSTGSLRAGAPPELQTRFAYHSCSGQLPQAIPHIQRVSCANTPLGEAGGWRRKGRSYVQRSALAHRARA